MATHECPAVGCTQQVDHTRLACARDWYRLPTGLRDRVWAAYGTRRTDPRGHAAAVQEAMNWYAAHP